MLSKTDVTHIDCETCGLTRASECTCDRTEIFRCEECEYETEMDYWVAPDEPCCPCCWNGSFSQTPVMQIVNAEGGGDS